MNLNKLFLVKELYMRKLIAIIGLLTMSSTTFAQSAAKLSNCVLLGAPMEGPASAVVSIPFGESADNSVGALERKASIDSTTVVLGEAGTQTYITIEDSKAKVYFTSSFERSAMYSTPSYTFQVNCK